MPKPPTLGIHLWLSSKLRRRRPFHVSLGVRIASSHPDMSTCNYFTLRTLIVRWFAALLVSGLQDMLLFIIIIFVDKCM